MINAGTHDTVLDKSDGWTVRTKDGSLSAQYEHTILMTEDGAGDSDANPRRSAAGTSVLRASGGGQGVDPRWPRMHC